MMKAATKMFLTILMTQPVTAQMDDSKMLDGKFLYEDYAECAKCHGMDGRGLVEERQLDPLPPDFSDCSFNSREPRKDWKAVISRGGPARGLAETMPAYGEALTEEQIDAIIDYIKTFCLEKGWPDGELNFRRPLITSKAFPENEAVMTLSYEKFDNEVVSNKFVYERRFGKRSHWEVAIPFSAEFGNTADGLGNIELSVKHVLIDALASKSILSGGLELVTPTSRSGIGVGGGSWKIAPYLAAAKGFGAFAIQSNLKLETPIEGDTNDSELFFNLAFTQALTREKKGLFPMLEMNAIRELSNGDTALILTPQVYFAFVDRGHIALSLGSQIPVAGEKPYDYRLVAFLLWEYADGGLWW